MLNPDKDASIFKSWKLDWLDSLAVILSLWFGFFRYPFEPLFCVLACIPIIGISISLSKGNATFDNYVKNIAGGVLDVNIVSIYILFVSIALLIGPITTYQCDNYYTFFITGTICFGFVMTVLLITHKSIWGTFMLQSKLYVVFLFCILFYSYGLTYGLNCIFDQSPPEHYKTKIVSLFAKKVNGRLKYFVTVLPWGNHTTVESLAIPYDQFRRLKQDDSTHVILQHGFLGIPWYHIEEIK